MKLTPSQEALLIEIRAHRAYYISGAQVRTARRLEALGLVVLEDNGPMVIHGRSDGERWSVEPVGCWYPRLEARWGE